MSEKIITIDDHAGTPIDEAQIPTTRTSIALTRGTDQTVMWDALNLSDESWDELVKTLREFCPEYEPNMSGEAHAAHVTSNQRIALMEADARATEQAQALELAAELATDAEQRAYEAQQAQAQALAVQRTTPKATAPKATAPTARLSQGEQRKRSAAVRSWWQSLSPQALKALSLPEAKSGPGKMPAAVYDAYNAAHSS